MSTRFPTRAVIVVALAAVLGFVLALGCTPAQSTVNAILGQEIQSALGNVPNPVDVRIINQTGVNIELDILVDNASVRISCTAIQGVCDQPLVPCPARVEAVQELMLDDQGHFTGGRNFNGSPDFTFTSPDEFKCGSVIIYEFTDTGASAFVL